MTDFLSTLVRERRADAAAARAWRSLAQVRLAAQRAAMGRGSLRFSDVIRNRRGQGRLGVIAEVKRTSPALGRLAEIDDPGALARSYVRAGATAISVIVEPRHWGGSIDDLRAVRSVEHGIGYGIFDLPNDALDRPSVSREVPPGAYVDLIPILAKDVVVDEYQIAEAGAAGADAVLLIAEALDDAAIARLVAFAAELGIETLVEAHEPDAFARAVRSDATMIGVNARDLREPSRIDRRRVHQLATGIATDQILVAESGIASVEDAEALPLRVDAILVGTALVSAPDPAPLIRALAGARPGRALA